MSIARVTVLDFADEQSKKEHKPQTKQVPIRNRRGRITGYRTVEV